MITILFLFFLFIRGSLSSTWVSEEGLNHENWCRGKLWIDGVCGSGKNADCRGSFAEARCTEFDAQFISTNVKVTKLSGNYGQTVRCPSGSAMTFFCGSGKNEDCNGSSTWTWMGCKYGITTTGAEIRYNGGWGERITCRDGYVGTGVCTSGKNADCDGHWTILYCKKFTKPTPRPTPRPSPRPTPRPSPPPTPAPTPRPTPTPTAHPTHSPTTPHPTPTPTDHPTLTPTERPQTSEDEARKACNDACAENDCTKKDCKKAIPKTVGHCKYKGKGDDRKKCVLKKFYGPCDTLEGRDCKKMVKAGKCTSDDKYHTCKDA